MLLWTAGIVVATMPLFVAAKGAAKATYPQVQSAWHRVLGFTSTTVVWHEECSARERSPSVRQVLAQSFESWKKRNRYMDELRDNVFRRARLEGGDAEATRLAQQLQLLVEQQAKSIRAEIRDGSSLDCSRLLYVLSQQESDLLVTYKREIEVLQHAAD
jgi:hypothetical protein